MSVSLIDGHIDDDVMTFEELIEELEKVRYNVTSEYHKAVIDDAIDTLKSQKAEIERLQSILLRFMDEVARWEEKKGIDVSELPLIPICDEGRDIIDHYRATAIKQFAERLKENKIDIDVSFGYGREVYTEAVAVIEIDNLVKEMVGEG